MSFFGSTVGRLTRDSELKAVSDDRAVLCFGLATDRPGKNDDADFYTCELWCRPGDKRVDYLKKGDQVYVRGRQENEKYTAKDGTEKMAQKIIVDSYGGLVMLGGKGNGGSSEAASEAPQPATVATGADDDEVPF